MYREDFFLKINNRVYATIRTPRVPDKMAVNSFIMEDLPSQRLLGNSEATAVEVLAFFLEEPFSLDIGGILPPGEQPPSETLTGVRLEPEPTTLIPLEARILTHSSSFFDFTNLDNLLTGVVKLSEFVGPRKNSKIMKKKK